MSNQISRREFVQLGGASVLAAAGAAPAGAAPAVVRRRRAVVVASANGHQHKHGGPRTCVEEAYERMARGEDVLDALIAGVNILELDPEETSVGYGGLPNADGVVQLDASCMHGPSRRAGAVAALEGVRTPSLVARAVMLHTDHHLLVGKEAQIFAADLNTEKSRRLWLEWKRRIDPAHWPDHSRDPQKRTQAAHRAAEEMMAEGLVDPDHYHGTVNCNGVNDKGELAGITSTSGLAWKIPGRVGDSPILGAGLYVDNAVGACGSTGRGEANLYNLSSFLIIEALRRGMHPKDAGLLALRRIRENTVERRLLNARGNPNFDVKFYILGKGGAHAGVAMYAGPKARYAVCTEKGGEILPCEGLLPEDAGPG
jgi:N4-(beta-N-acetylglucosaminyl)-L-asparaginase